MIPNLNKQSQESPEMTGEEALATIRRCAAPYIIYGEDDARNLYTLWDEQVDPDDLEKIGVTNG